MPGGEKNTVRFRNPVPDPPCPVLFGGFLEGGHVSEVGIFDAVREAEADKRLGDLINCLGGAISHVCCHFTRVLVDGSQV
jgi:hypothetical protein